MDTLTGDTISRDFDEILDAAERAYPGLSQEIEVFSAHQVEMESYYAYLELMNETPAVVTANRAT